MGGITLTLTVPHHFRWSTARLIRRKKIFYNLCRVAAETTVILQSHEVIDLFPDIAIAQSRQCQVSINHRNEFVRYMDEPYCLYVHDIRSTSSLQPDVDYTAGFEKGIVAHMSQSYLHDRYTCMYIWRL